MRSEPRFSIVIPTRNRGHLLHHALDTALALQGSDYEVLVVDNESSDETSAVLAARAEHPALRVVRTSPRLSQADNWEAAFDHARGEWLVLLGDDDAVPASFLVRLSSAVDVPGTTIVAWHPAFYVHDEWQEQQARNRLTVHRLARSTWWASSQIELNRLVQRRETIYLPKVGNNAAVHRSAVTLVRAVLGRSFLPPIPDFSFATALLATHHRYLVIDQPLSIVGLARSSAGFSVDERNQWASGFLGGLAGEGRTNRTPLRSPAISNLVAESILTALAALDENGEHHDRAVPRPPFDWARYFVTCRDDLARTARHSDVVDEVAQWRSTLDTQPRSVRIRVALDRSGRSARTKLRAARSRIAHHGMAVEGEPYPGSPLATFQGAAAGFHDIAGAAAFLEAALLMPVPVVPPDSDRPRIRRPGQVVP